MPEPTQTYRLDFDKEAFLCRWLEKLMTHCTEEQVEEAKQEAFNETYTMEARSND